MIQCQKTKHKRNLRALIVLLAVFVVVVVVSDDQEIKQK